MVKKKVDFHWFFTYFNFLVKSKLFRNYTRNEKINYKRTPLTIALTPLTSSSKRDFFCQTCVITKSHQLFFFFFNSHIVYTKSLQLVLLTFGNLLQYLLLKDPNIILLLFFILFRVTHGFIFSTQNHKL